MLNGLDQGDPFSQLLYILYNASLFRLFKKKGLNSLGFVDDAAAGARAKTFPETHAKLKTVMEVSDGVLNWTTTHNCIFGIPKWQLLDCTARTRSAPHPKLPGKTIRVPNSRDGIMIGGRLIKVKRAAKFLGVLINVGLTWESSAGNKRNTTTIYQTGVPRDHHTTDSIRRGRLPHPQEGYVKVEKGQSKLTPHHTTTRVHTPLSRNTHIWSYEDDSREHCQYPCERHANEGHSRQNPSACHSPICLPPTETSITLMSSARSTTLRQTPPLPPPLAILPVPRPAQAIQNNQGYVVPGQLEK